MSSKCQCVYLRVLSFHESSRVRRGERKWGGGSGVSYSLLSPSPRRSPTANWTRTQRLRRERKRRTRTERDGHGRTVLGKETTKQPCIRRVEKMFQTNINLKSCSVFVKFLKTNTLTFTAFPPFPWSAWLALYFVLLILNSHEFTSYFLREDRKEMQESDESMSFDHSYVIFNVAEWKITQNHIYTKKTGWFLISMDFPFQCRYFSSQWTIAVKESPSFLP